MRHASAGIDYTLSQIGTDRITVTEADTNIWNKNTFVYNWGIYKSI